MKTGTTRHRKVYALAESLGIRRAEAIGILTAFWEMASEQFPTGDISRAPLTYLAEQCLWYPDRGQELTDALVESELLDRLDGGRLYIHDWHDHCENTVHRKLWRRKLWFANGLSPKIAALDRADKPEATEWYKVNVPQNSGGIPAEDSRITLKTPAVAVAVAVASAVTPAIAVADTKASLSADADGSNPKPPQKRNPDVWWDTVCEVFNLTPITKSDKSRIGKLKRDFQAKCEAGGFSPQEINRRRLTLASKWPNIDVTPEALLKHWDAAANSPPPTASDAIALRNWDRLHGGAT